METFNLGGGGGGEVFGEKLSIEKINMIKAWKHSTWGGGGSGLKKP